MLIHLHSQATTTPPKVRAAIQASVEPASALAERFGTTEQTIYKGKHRDTVHDRSHTPHRLQIETEQETIQWIKIPAIGHHDSGGPSVARQVIAQQSPGGERYSGVKRA